MRFAVRTSASVATAVALGCFLTGCQAVQYGVGSNSKNIKMDQTTDPIDFSRQFVEANVYGIDPYGKLEVQNLSDRRQLQAYWCSKNTKSIESLSSKLSQLCALQGGKPEPIRGHYWCYRPNDRTVLFDWHEIWDKKAGEKPAKCVLGEREKIVVSAPLGEKGHATPEWIRYWKTANVDKAYDARMALLEPPKITTESNPASAKSAPKAQKSVTDKPQKIQSTKKLSQQELDFQSLNTKEQSVVLEGHKLNYSLMKGSGAPIIMIPGEEGKFVWFCTNCFNYFDARKGFSPDSFPARPDKVLKFVSITFQKANWASLLVMARAGETIPEFGDAKAIVIKYDISCSPTLQKRMQSVTASNLVPNSTPRVHTLKPGESKWSPVTESEPLFSAVDNACHRGQ